MRPPGSRRGGAALALAALYPALRGRQEAGWMFAIITQLQLPQSCRHSNGAGRPSRAAKWQEGARALWAGRGGVARAPGAVPPAPPPGRPLPRGQRERGFVWAPGGWRGPGEAPADACSCCRPLGRGGAGVRRAGGARGPCGSGLNLGLVLPPGCPRHTPGSLGLATHNVISGPSQEGCL